MKGLIVAGVCVLLAAFLIVSPAAAQGRNAPSGAADAGRGAAGAAAAAAAASAVASGASTSTTSSSSYSYGGNSTWMGDTGFGRSSTSTSSSSIPSINLSGTSFGSKSTYRDWSQYYRTLSYSWDGCTAYMQGWGFVRASNAPQSVPIIPIMLADAPHCGFTTTYFARFERNVEPLMTPEMLKFTLRQPLLTSQYMLQAIDQLEALLEDARAGKPADKGAIATKAREIRDYAKRIRQDPTLELYDIRDENDVLGNDKIEALSPETITKLRELALDIHLQLQNLSSLSSSSTMSVDSYKEPSFESMTKGIEKVCKAIENSSKRL